MDSEIIKTYNKELNMLIISNIFILSFINGDISNLNRIFQFIGTFIISFFPSLLILNFIPLKYKKWFVFINSKDIFNYLEKENDKRINFKLLNNHYNYSKKDSQQQHELWYCLYRKHEDNPRIIGINKQYLMSRDFVVLNLILTIIILILTLFYYFDIINFIIWLLFMFFETLILIKFTNRFSKSLLKSVLMEESFQLNKYNVCK